MLSPHRCKARRLLALSLACWALSGHAQQRITADEAVALALSQPHVRQELDAGVGHARSEVLAARTWSNPELELLEERDRSAPGGDGRETSVVLSQEIELGGRRGLRIDAAELGIRAAEVTARYERARLRGEVLRAYSRAVAAETLRDSWQRSATGLATLADIAGHRHQAGDLSGYESRRIAQASAQAEADAALADTEARAARAHLVGWIGKAALTAELDTTPPLPALPTVSAETGSAELEVLQARREHAAAQARAERRLALPLNIGVGTKRVEEAGISDNVMIVELGVPLPLFDRNQAARARAAADSQLAEARYQRALLQTEGRRAAALAEAAQLSESARTLLRFAVPEAARLTTIARNSFAEGELDLVGLLDAHQAETDVIQQALDQQSRALEALLELQLLSPLDPDVPNPTHLKE
ncbi:TolC family protein [Novilysobacter spongiicola]|uniref:Outer membrane protein, cobalt-zinc-cadmium efflux system n=1 Tax=Lysobacter spongiicola DSM 21749 TaxID=1122188 RepID=A0A1T4ND84_9GAMM|nr:TolC family protein [Lysobacter spongiicola]SJZ76957.1 outer membrane protein, cobalt-zinc-cadmium efflux system [Lysobacter spongiicola DSM 21749]